MTNHFPASCSNRIYECTCFSYSAEYFISITNIFSSNILRKVLDILWRGPAGISVRKNTVSETLFEPKTLHSAITECRPVSIIFTYASHRVFSASEKKEVLCAKNGQTNKTITSITLYRQTLAHASSVDNETKTKTKPSIKVERARRGISASAISIQYAR